MAMSASLQVFQSQGENDKAAACNDQVVKIWTAVLCRVVLGVVQTADGLVPEATAPAELPVGRLQLMEVVDMLLDIGRARVAAVGPAHASVADAHFATALALVQLEEGERASEQLDAAAAVYSSAPDSTRSKLMEMARIMVGSI